MDNIDIVSEHAQIALLVSLLLTFIGVYIVSRHGFYVPVNCWFCNKNCKVLFSKRNCFDCPICFQYNGFTKNGDYNKVIDAQFNPAKNAQQNIYYKNEPKTCTIGNSLCNMCNNNMRLKVYQLANFEPLNENNFDKEVEHFEKQLDKAYKLCAPCEKILKTTVARQHFFLFGKHYKHFRNKGISYFKSLHNQHYSNFQQHNVAIRISRYLLLFLSSLILYENLNAAFLKIYIPHFIIYYGNVLNDSYIIVKNVLTMMLYINVPSEVCDLLNIPLSGLILELVLFLVENCSLLKIHLLISWTTLLAASVFIFTLCTFCSSEVIQVLCSIGHIYLYGKYCLSRKQNKQSIKLNMSETQLDDVEYSDVDEDEPVNLKRTNSSNTALHRLNYFCDISKQKTEPLLKFNDMCASRKNLDYSFESAKSEGDSNSNKGLDNFELNKSFRSLNLSMGHKCNNSSFQDYVFLSNPPVRSQLNAQNIFQYCNTGSPCSYVSTSNCQLAEPSSRSKVPTFMDNLQYVPEENTFLKSRLVSPCLFTNNVQNFATNIFEGNISDTSYFRSPFELQNNSYLQEQQSYSTPVNMTFRPITPITSVHGQRRTILSPPKLIVNPPNQPVFVYRSCFTSRNLAKSRIYDASHHAKSFNVPPRSNSQSSGQSSGFMSSNETQRYSHPVSRDNSPDRFPILSDPMHHFKVIDSH